MPSIHMKAVLKAENVRDKKKDLQPSVNFCLQMCVCQLIQLIHFLTGVLYIFAYK
jgi:hypothetical protein